MVNSDADLPSSNSRAPYKLAVCLLIVLAFVLIANASFDPLFATAPNAPLVQQAGPSRSRTPAASSTVPAWQQAAQRGSGPRTIIGQTTADANTVALYHFDTDASDATNRYNAIFIGNAGVTYEGLYGGALSVDGGSFVNVPVSGRWGAMNQGTVEFFIDFSTMCSTTWNFSILSAGSAFGSGQDLLEFKVGPGLYFGVNDGTQWHWVDSGINPCRYLAGGYPPAGSMWPYETWRFHHVAGTWGPRGVEIWVDGVLHGVATTDPTAGQRPYKYMCNPQQQMGVIDEPPNPAYPVCRTPVMASMMTTTPPGDYAGGIPVINNMLIGCNSSASCFKGRLDEVRVSNVQRIFEWTVDPTSTPIPTATPVSLSRPYSPDAETLGLYHLDFSIPQGFFSAVYNEVTQQTDAGFIGNAAIFPGGHFNAALSLGGEVAASGALPQLEAGNLGSPGNGAVEAWVYLERADTFFTVLNATSNRGDGTQQDRMILGAHPPNGNVGFGLDTGSTWVWAESRIYPQDLVGGWHHLAGTWGTRGMELWLDGKMCTRYDYYGRIYFPIYRYHVGCDALGRCAQAVVDEWRVSGVQRTFVMSADRSRTSSGFPWDQLSFPAFLPLVNLGPTAVPAPARIPCSPM